MKHSLQDAVAVVTGAAGGVGRATARELAKRGAHVALLARGVDALEAAQREIERLGRRALVLPVDVSDAAMVDAAAGQVEHDLGPIDVWVNDAMVSVFAPFLDITPDELRRVTEVTYLGVAHGTRSALRRMKLRDRGVIVQVGSALAYRSIPLQSAYCAAKHAVHGLTESIRVELRHDKSRVHLCEVQLPAVNTPQFTWSRAKLPRHPQPVPPIFEPELAADAIAFAAEHRRREIWLGWPTIKAVLSEKLAPRLGDIVLARTGYDGQQTSQPLRADRPDDLFEPAPGDYGARGEFSDRAKSFSLTWWMSKHRAALGGVAGGVAVVAALIAAWA